MEWNKHLRHERNLLGWSQTMLAQKLGTNTHTVSRWERGTAFPSPFYREQLSEIFGKSIKELGLSPELKSNSTQQALVLELESNSTQQALGPELKSNSTQQTLVLELENSNTQQVWLPPDLEYGYNEEHTVKALLTPGTETHVEPLLERPHSQPRKLFATTFWQVFALSGVIVLVISIMLLDILIPLRSLDSMTPMKSFPAMPPSLPTVTAPSDISYEAAVPQNTLASSPDSMLPVKSYPATPPPLPTAIALSGTSYEAAASQNTLTGGARPYHCSSCFAGVKVSFIGKGGSLQFNNVIESLAGNYILTLYYVDGDVGRAVYMSVNDEPATILNVSGTGSWNTIGAIRVIVHLKAGKNSIKFFNPVAYAPDIDTIIV